jgi:tetratricopeptide (TPR) repeat protein
MKPCTPISAALALATLVLAGCAATSADPAATADRLPTGAEAWSFLGEPLHPPALAPATRQRLEADLAEATAGLERAPSDADALIWVGRRLAYLGRYREAIEVFGQGIARHPDDARFYRHRGHRWITVRELDRAIADLSRAAELVRGKPDEVEPDGMPNPYGIPTSTLQSNIWYHLALAHYLAHEFERAVPAWRAALAVSTNDDMFVATSDWLYMTLRRLGQDAEAAAVLEPIHVGMRILENDAYHRRLLMYRGELEPDVLLEADTDDPVQLATYGYGVGNWYLYNGDTDRAHAIFRRILAGPGWAAFGYLAAEAELRSSQPAPRSSQFGLVSDYGAGI